MLVHLCTDNIAKRASTQRLTRRTFYLSLLFASVTVLILLALVAPFSARLSDTPLKVGDVSPQDILAPRSLTYESQILTEQKRDEAPKNIAPIYTPADPSIARQQLER